MASRGESRFTPCVCRSAWISDHQPMFFRFRGLSGAQYFGRIANQTKGYHRKARVVRYRVEHRLLVISDVSGMTSISANLPERLLVFTGGRAAYWRGHLSRKQTSLIALGVQLPSLPLGDVAQLDGGTGLRSRDVWVRVPSSPLPFAKNNSLFVSAGSHWFAKS
jgi:hypothetical protein